jgi:cell division protease FtsH
MSDSDSKKPRRPLKNLPPERFQPKMLFFWLALAAAVVALLMLPNQTGSSPESLTIQEVVERAEIT